MAQHYYLGFVVLMMCFCFEAASRPSNNESSTSLKVEVPIEDLLTEAQDEQRSLPEEESNGDISTENTKDILDKINAINERLKKPNRQPIHFNAPPHPGSGYILDSTILEKIQQIIASGKLHGQPGKLHGQPGKLHGQPGKQKEEENNYLTNNDIILRDGSRALRYVQPTLASNGIQDQAAVVPLPYLTSIPVVVMPTDLGSTNGYPANNNINPMFHSTDYMTRQQLPSLPFQIQWPLASFFPVLVKDPLLHYLQGGRWENLVEYGQNADVCNRKQKSTEDEITNSKEIIEGEGNNQLDNNIFLNPVNVVNARQGRKIKRLKKRTVSKSVPQQALNNVKSLPNIFSKPLIKPVTSKPPKKVETIQDTKQVYSDDDEGDLRMPFSDFTWFGNRKPVAPSPGFFINRLKVRRGGVAIAGPGGVATAGRGGTALVGPGGLAYTQPGGLAVAGPAAKVIALSSDADLNSIVTRLQQQAATDGSVPRLLQAIPEGKVVATGPVIYYHPYNA